MKKSEEPPSKFVGKKDSKKNVENISQLLTLLKNSKKKIQVSEKNIETRVSSNEKFPINDYTKTSEYFSEDISLTNKHIEFTKTRKDSNFNRLNPDYLQDENTSLSQKNPEKFYQFKSSYSFLQQNEEKKENFDYEKPKEVIYNLFDEENAEEESLQIAL